MLVFLQSARCSESQYLTLGSTLRSSKRHLLKNHLVKDSFSSAFVVVMVSEKGRSSGTGEEAVLCVLLPAQRGEPGGGLLLCS